MFNGIIYNHGFVKSIRKFDKESLIEINSNLKFVKKDLGSSVSCDGVCLTLTKIKAKSLFFYLSSETIKKSTFQFLKIGKKLNLEKSLFYGQRISGHYVQGHVDTIGVINDITILGNVWKIRISINSKYKKYLIEKASISINGVSLTISKIILNKFEVVIIPHTLKLTNLIKLKKRDYVNIELDIFSKYLIEIKK